MKEKFGNFKQHILKGCPICILDLDSKSYKLYKDIKSVPDGYDEYTFRYVGLTVSNIPLTWDIGQLNKALKTGVTMEDAEKQQVSSVLLEIQISKS